MIDMDKNQQKGLERILKQFGVNEKDLTFLGRINELEQDTRRY